MRVVSYSDHYVRPEHFADYTVWMLNGADPWLMRPLRSFAAEYGLSEKQRSGAEIVRHLRALVNQWIDSGKDSHGIEEPSKRNVITVLPDAGERLTDVLQEWIDRHKPSARIMGTGEVAVFDPPIPSLRGVEPALFAREYAVFWLYKILNSPVAARIARCSNRTCGAYYLRRRVRNSAIKRGTYCVRCSGVGSTVRTNASRERRKQTLINLAADVWPADWKPTVGYSKLSDWVAARMKKKKMSPPVEITGRWVTEKRKEIEMEVERRKHAKG